MSKRKKKVDDRTLHIIGMVHDDPESRNTEVARQFSSLYEWFQKLDPSKVHVYVERLFTSDDLKAMERDFSECSGKDSLEGVVGDLVRRGALLKATESECLHRIAGEVLALGELVGGMVENPETQVLDKRLEELFETINKDRDCFIATQIETSLKSGDIGILFIGADHDVGQQLPPSIEVQEWSVFRE